MVDVLLKTLFNSLREAMTILRRMKKKMMMMMMMKRNLLKMNYKNINLFYKIQIMQWVFIILFIYKNI